MPAPNFDIDRNYLDEAIRIARDGALIPIERHHLVALFQNKERWADTAVALNQQIERMESQRFLEQQRRAS